MISFRSILKCLEIYRNPVYQVYFRLIFQEIDFSTLYLLFSIIYDGVSGYKLYHLNSCSVLIINKTEKNKYSAYARTLTIINF